MEPNDDNYKHLGFGHYSLENFDGPKIGTIAPDFTATMLDNKTTPWSDFRGKIVVLESASITCPATIGTTNDMQQLVRQYPDVAFLLLYVREAHPAERIPAHTSFDEKLSCAKRFHKEENDNRIIVVDDLEGTVHKQYGLFPNYVYVIDPEGYITWRTPWNVTKRLNGVLASIHENFHARFSEEYLLPEIKNQGFRALKRAGWRTILDLIPNIPYFIWIRHRLKKIGRRY